MKKPTKLKKIDGLTVKEAAYFLQVAPKTVYGWCNAGKLEHFKIAGSIRIKEEHLGQILHRNPPVSVSS